MSSVVLPSEPKALKIQTEQHSKAKEEKKMEPTQQHK